MEPWPAESTKRSRSGQRGAAGSNLRKRVNRTVAISAAPIGRPGWPDFACSTASMASARIALAMRSWSARGDAAVRLAAIDDAAAADAAARGVIVMKGRDLLR